MGFKEAIKEYGKEITASFVCNGTTYTDNDIISMNPHYEGSLLTSVMKCLDIELKRPTNISVGSYLENVRFGVKGPGDADYFYKEYGTYIVKDMQGDEEQGTIILECYDKMLESMVPYDINIEFPTSVNDIVYDICVRFGWENGSSVTGYSNMNTMIYENPYNNSYTFRDVLTEIAQVAGCIIAFTPQVDTNGNFVDTLSFIYPTDKGEIIDTSNLKSLKVGEVFGPVNSVVFARSPQEDNIYRRDEDSISANGLTDIRIDNNQIVEVIRRSGYESDITQTIEATFTSLSGLQYTMYELESFGIGCVDLGDIFTIVTDDGVSHKALMLCDDFQITQGLSETSSLEAPEATETDYKAASTTDKLLNKTILMVDKQAQEITALVSKTETVSGSIEGLSETVTHMAEVMMDSDSVDIKISTAVGDIDSITTSTGYTFDESGLNIHKDGESIRNRLDNTGMYVTDGDEAILTANKDGVSAINLTSRQFLIVGDNSRFENYDNGTDSNRTACFYIGG